MPRTPSTTAHTLLSEAGTGSKDTHLIWMRLLLSLKVRIQPTPHAAEIKPYGLSVLGV